MTDWRLEADNEWTSRDPFGRVKPADRSGRSCPVTDAAGVHLRAARNGYVSFRLGVAGAGEYRLAVEVNGPLEVDLFRAFYHEAPGVAGPAWYADALVPVAPDTVGQLPDPANAIDAQTHQEFWVDVFVPPDAPVGEAAGRVRLNDDVELPLRVDVAEATIPDADAVLLNRHSYGCRWVWDQYPSLFAGIEDPRRRWEKTIEVLHDVYRLVYEHRGLLTNRGVGHSDTFDPIYGPTLIGQGRDKRIDDWTLFDLHYGPLLDGSAFETAAPMAPRPRRRARPIWCVATPICAGWPADYLYWGQGGYKVEFVNCVGQFDRHFRRNGWTTTHPYLFFVHKKRYRWLEWDGDEPKYAKDHRYFAEMGRLFRMAVGDTPVPWLFRMDASWQMEREFRELAGVIDWWVCGGFIRWFPRQVRQAVARGETVWQYSGPPPITAASSALLEHLWRAFARGVGGHCYWNAFSSGPDPWFASDGNATQLFYPGGRFGIAGPIPSARLKLERNAVQDVNLLAAGLDVVRERLAEAAPIRLWQDPPPAVRQLRPEDWDSRNLSGSQDDLMSQTQPVDPLWWADIRNAALGESA